VPDFYEEVEAYLKKNGTNSEFQLANKQRKNVKGNL